MPECLIRLGTLMASPVRRDVEGKIFVVKMTQFSARGANIRALLLVLALSLTASVAQADATAAAACRADLSPVGQDIYDASVAQNPTPSTGRSIVTKVVEHMMAEGKISLSDGRKEGKAAGACLEKLE